MKRKWLGKKDRFKKPSSKDTLSVFVKYNFIIIALRALISSV